METHETEIMGFRLMVKEEPGGMAFELTVPEGMHLGWRDTYDSGVSGNVRSVALPPLGRPVTAPDGRTVKPVDRWYDEGGHLIVKTDTGENVVWS